MKLLEIFAHPDDESPSTGGTLVQYAAEGVETYLAYLRGIDFYPV